MSDFTFDNDDFGFELSDANAPELQSYAAVPPGAYDAQLESAEVKPTKSGGRQISVRFAILGPAQEGRKLFDNIIIRHVGDNAEVVEKIGLEKLERLRVAAGLASVSKASQLIGARVNLTVRARKDQPTETEIDSRKYAPYTGGVPVIKSNPVVANAPSAANTGARPPWAK